MTSLPDLIVYADGQPYLHGFVMILLVVGIEFIIWIFRPVWHRLRRLLRLLWRLIKKKFVE